METNQLGSILRHLDFDVYQTRWGYFQLTGHGATGEFDKETSIKTRLQIESLCNMLKVPAVVKVITLPQTAAQSEDQEEDQELVYVVALWVNLDD